LYWERLRLVQAKFCMISFSACSLPKYLWVGPDHDPKVEGVWHYTGHQNRIETPEYRILVSSTARSLLGGEPGLAQANYTWSLSMLSLSASASDLITLNIVSSQSNEEQ